MSEIQDVIDLVLSRVGKNQYTQNLALRVKVFEGYSDCSSLQWKCYERGAGIYIGANTREQITKGNQVYNNTSGATSLPASLMEPGDLVFFEGAPGGHGSGSSEHVEMYIGNNQLCGHGSGIGPTIKNANSYIASSPSWGNYFSEVRRYIEPGPKLVSLVSWIPG